MKNCITILSRGDIKTLKELKASLDDLYKKYVNKFPCDVIIFHEDDFPEAFKGQAVKKYKDIKFKKIVLKEPDTLTPENLKFKDPTTFLGISYRNMCRFYAMEFYKHLEEYDWYWRLDVDSVILSDIDFDVFSFLEDNKKVYGYVGEVPEHPPVIQHFDKFIKTYKEKNKTDGKFTNALLDEKGNYNHKMIYNNFEICKLEVFKTEEAQNFLREIDATGYIYEYRWGDAPIRTAMLSFVVNQDQMHRFKNIDYQHQDFIQKDGVIDCNYIPYDWIKNESFIA